MYHDVPNRVPLFVKYRKMRIPTASSQWLQIPPGCGSTSAPRLIARPEYSECEHPYWLTLEAIFDYRVGGLDTAGQRDPLEFYWKGGLSSLSEELRFYELGGEV